MNAKEADAELNKVAASTGEVRNVLNMLLGSGLDELHARLGAVETSSAEGLSEVRKKLLELEAVAARLDERVKPVERTGVEVVRDVFYLTDRLSKVEDALQVVDQGAEAVEMDRLKRVEKDLEKLLAEAQARNQTLHQRVMELQAELGDYKKRAP